MFRGTLAIFVLLLALSVVLPVAVYRTYSSFYEDARDFLRVHPFPQSLEIIAHSRPGGEVKGTLVSFNKYKGTLVLRTPEGYVFVIVRGCWRFKERILPHTFLPLEGHPSLEVKGILVDISGKKVIVAQQVHIDDLDLHRARCPGHSREHWGHRP